MKSGAQKRKEREKLLLALDAKKSKKITSFTNTTASASTLAIVQERQEATGKERKFYIINLFYFFVYLLILC